jgi:phosphoribosylformylglycinamidine cyclo-ligase
MNQLYAQRGVSAQKEEVHAATANLYKGLFPHAFCQVFPDIIAGDDNFVNLMHDDTAGTKSILAYLYWKETGDMSVWAGVAQDCIVMNLDDLICTGAYNNIAYTGTISRNKHLIPAPVLQAIIEGTDGFFNKMKDFGITITYAGGETADVGDLVQTVDIAGTMMVRMPKEKIISNEKIAEGNVIVGLCSYGKASYETEYNSGIGSNGLTSARHDMLNKYYATTYPESYYTKLDDSVSYIGQYKLTDTHNEAPLNIGKLLLSPTRTYAPVIKEILENNFNDIYGIIHCSGGGQTKCMKYLPKPLHIIKDNLFDIPILFKLIQQQSNASYQEMFQVFNMGHRLEIFTNETTAAKIIDTAKAFNIEAKVVGRVAAAENNTKACTLKGNFGTLHY